MASREERRQQREERKLQRLQNKANAKRDRAQNDADSVGVVGMVRALVTQTLVDMDLIDDSSSTQGQIAKADAKHQRKQAIAKRIETRGGAEYSGLTKGLAGRVLRMGSNVPPELREMAADVSSGVGGYKEHELQERFRAYMGIRKGGGTAFRKGLARVRGALNSARNAFYNLQAAQQGGVEGTIAKMDMVSGAATKIDAAVHDKGVRAVASAVTNYIARDPGLGERLLSSIGRVARLAGPAVQIAVAAYQGAAFSIEERRRSAAAKIEAQNSARATFTEGPESRMIGNRSRAVTASERSAGVSALRDFFGGGARDEEASKKQIQQQEQVAAIREMLPRFGINPQQVLNAYARKIGRRVSDLSSADRALALNDAAMKTFSELRGSDSAYTYADQQVQKMTALDTIGQILAGSNLTSAQREARHRNFRNEFAERSVRGQGSIRKSANEEAERHANKLTESERLEIDRRARDGVLREASYRQRHKVRWTD